MGIVIVGCRWSMKGLPSMSHFARAGNPHCDDFILSEESAEVYSVSRESFLR